MLDDLDSAAKITSITEELLQRADAAGHWPTRVDDIVQAADCTEPGASAFDEAVLASAPTHLSKAVALLRGRGKKVRAILDRRAREIHIDPSIERSARRDFLRLHEVGHKVLPWQQDLAYADSFDTVAPSVKALFEREANQTSAELFFQGERATGVAADFRMGFGAVAAMSETTGASLRASLRRYAETHAKPVCGIVLEPSARTREPVTFKRFEVSQSGTWTTRFGDGWWPRMLNAQSFPWLSLSSVPVLGYPWRLHDVNGEYVDVTVDVRITPYNRLVVLWVPQREILKRKVKVLQTA